jgi:HEPN superfamily Swt1-like protein
MKFFDWLFDKPQDKSAQSDTPQLDERVFNRVWALNDNTTPPITFFHSLFAICLQIADKNPYHPAIEDVLVDFFANIVTRIPHPYRLKEDEYAAEYQLWQRERSNYKNCQPTVPLHDILLGLPNAICAAQSYINDNRLLDHGLLYDIRKQLEDNENSYHRVTTYERRKKRIPLPTEVDEAPADLVRVYLKDTIFYELFCTPIPWRIPDTVRSEHILMIASTGSGKTQFIQQDIFSQLSKSEPPGMVVIDSQNQMIPKLERLQIARDRIVIIDPFDEPAPALNMFIAPKRSYDANPKEAVENETLQQFAWIFSALDQELTGRMTTLFTFTARILLAMAPHSNMMTLLELLRIEKLQQLKASPFWSFIERSDEQSKYFFNERFCTSDFNKTKSGVADRLLGVMRVPAFNRMFMATDNRLDLYSELAQRKLIVFNTQKRKLGADASAVLGRYAIALYIRSAFEREADRAPPPAFLYIDEASEYFGKRDSTDTLFTQLRKYNCGTCVCFQDVSQLQQQTGTLIANTATKFAARVSPADAGVLASAMRTSAQHLLSIAKQLTSYQMACFIKDVMPNAMTITFPYGVIENAPQLCDAEHAELRDNNRRRLCDATPTARHHAALSEPLTTNQQIDEVSLRDIELPLPKTHQAHSAPRPKSDLDANNRVDKALRLLTAPLRTLIETELRRVYKDNWHHYLSVADRTDPSRPLDPYALLKTMLDNWQSCFKDTFKNKTRVDVSKAFDARNAFAHAGDEIPSAEAISYLVAIRDIAIAISAHIVVDTVKTFIDDQLASAATTTPPTPHPDKPLLKPGKDW